MGSLNSGSFQSCGLLSCLPTYQAHNSLPFQRLCNFVSWPPSFCHDRIQLHSDLCIFLGNGFPSAFQVMPVLQSLQYLLALKSWTFCSLHDPTWRALPFLWPLLALHRPASNLQPEVSVLASGPLPESSSLPIWGSHLVAVVLSASSGYSCVPVLCRL